MNGIKTYTFFGIGDFKGWVLIILSPASPLRGESIGLGA